MLTGDASTGKVEYSGITEIKQSLNHVCKYFDEMKETTKKQLAKLMKLLTLKDKKCQGLYKHVVECYISPVASGVQGAQYDMAKGGGCYITDKGLVERCLFPAPSLQLCLFHTLQPISREVNTETAIEACITRRWAV